MDQLQVIKEQMKQRLKKQKMEKSMVFEAKNEINEMVKNHKNNEY